MAADKVHPLALAAKRALERADSLGEDKRARWVPDEHAWLVPSSQPDTAPYTVRRRQPAGNVADASGDVASRHSGYGWAFVLTCSCPSEASGFVVCWHKAAVFRWWQKYRRVDGDAYGGLEAHSAALAHANDSPDPEGVERWKDRGPSLSDDPVYYVQPEERGIVGNDVAGETEVEAWLRERGVPERDALFDGEGEQGDIGAMMENTRRLLAGEELPR